MRSKMHSCQTQEEFAETLEVTQQAILSRLKAMGMQRPLKCSLLLRRCRRLRCQNRILQCQKQQQE
ncbi:hypothetical protein NECAME_09668 [Necator americanus]|uniref:Uncharacterized protein n=1 Tax=Necator americanus TaxID=51031 RepID=W2TDL1_NECAM|nr:hypothetical protein NECAME_09668 [Necator americanus]ETN79684.1 hypothetical protein NECAME_09668 [Necator americanus]